MKTGIIDIGSNSVRLMLCDGDKAARKRVVITRLAEGMKGGMLSETSMNRTASAVAYFFDEAKKENAEVLAFATAAVRNAANGKEFTDKVERLCGLRIDVISGEKEAEIGYKGALGGKDGGLIDVGGASTEIIVVSGGKKIYEKSVGIGVVLIKDACGQDEARARKFIAERLESYGELPKADYSCIGGTATSLAAMNMNLDPYDPEKVDGYILSLLDVRRLKEKTYSLSLEERRRIKGLQPERAEVIAGGAALLQAIMEKAKINEITVSERDNLEGYLADYLEKK